MAGMLELPDHELETSVMNMLRTLMGKIDDMQEQMGKVSREMEILRESKRNARDQNHCNRIKNASDGLISRLSTAEERISVLEDMARVLLLGALNINNVNFKNRKLSIWNPWVSKCHFYRQLPFEQHSKLWDGRIWKNNCQLQLWTLQHLFLPAEKWAFPLLLHLSPSELK